LQHRNRTEEDDMKSLALAAGILASSMMVSGVAIAGNDRNPTNAKSMAGALKGGGGGNNSALKSSLGLEGNGGVASFVSGNGTGGWGNAGSKLLGGQVSKPKK
jgi:hypothetical protein